MKGISLLLLLTACATAPSKPKDTITETFHGKDFLYRQCFHESDSYQGRLVDEKGKIEVKFDILDGKTAKAEILKTDFKDPNLHSCIKGVLKNLRFYDMDHVQDVTQTINFGHITL